MNIGELIIGILLATLFAVLEIYVGNRMFGSKAKVKTKNNIILILLYIAYLAFNMTISGRYLKIVLTYTILTTFYKILYKKDWNSAILGAFLMYCIIIMSEVIMAILLTVLTKVAAEWIENNWLLVTIIINIISFLVNLALYKIFEKKILQVIKKKKQIKAEYSMILYLILLITATLILSRINIINWEEIRLGFVINTIILMVFFGILLYVSSQTQKYDKIREKYSKLSTYSQVNDGLLEEYRMKSHEFNNQLAIIKTMSDSSNEELQKYLDTLIKKNRKNKYSWVNEVKYIQLAGLKGLINYKIMEMKSLKLDIELSISKQVKKFDFKNFTAEEQDHLYSIIGVYLDNAKEAALLSKDKEIVIDIYADNGEMIITIGNTYSGKINLNKIGEYNYSTKGKSRGVGLHLVDNIIKTDANFVSKTEIRDKFFVQELTIKNNKKST